MLADLEPHRSTVRMLFQRAILTKWQEVAGKLSSPIAINIRCGRDFRPAPATNGPLPPFSQTPMDWYIKTLQRLRSDVGRDLEAIVVSDGHENQLKPILKLGNVKLARPASAASDLLLLAKAKVLLANGQSSFSAWGAFLGEGIALCHPGQDLAWFGISEERIIRYDPGKPLPNSHRLRLSELGL
jgi:hypothetical protein